MNVEIGAETAQYLFWEYFFSNFRYCIFSVCLIHIAGQCRSIPWPAVPDWPWCRNADAGLTQLTYGKNAHAGLTFFRHSGIYKYPQHPQFLTKALGQLADSQASVSSIPCPANHSQLLASHLWAPYNIQYSQPFKLIVNIIKHLSKFSQSISAISTNLWTPHTTSTSWSQLVAR